MQLLPILTAVAEQSIPGRPATWQESLRLMGAGWGSIFIVILVIMLCVYLLNRIFRSKDPKIKTARALPKAAPAFCNMYCLREALAVPYRAADNNVQTDCVCSGGHCAAVGGFAALRMRRALYG